MIKVLIESPFAGATQLERDMNLLYARQAMHDCFERGACADKTVVYTDRGISYGMQYGIENAKKAGRPIEYRSMADWGFFK